MSCWVRVIVEGKPSCTTRFEPEFAAFWNKWRGKMILLGRPIGSNRYGCNSDAWLVEAPPEILADGRAAYIAVGIPDPGLTFGVCRHCVEAGD